MKKELQMILTKKKKKTSTDIPSVILESYWFEVNDHDKHIAETYAKSDDDKIFGIDKTFSNNMSNTISFILESNNFDNFVNKLFECVKKTDNISLYSKWSSDAMIKETLQKALEKELSKMYIGEVLQYENVVDDLFKKHEITESYQTMTNNGYNFSELPRIVRIH